MNDEDLLLKLGHPKMHDLGIGTKDFNFNDIVIHQLIETIEFVLGTVSNTASYLRLWALSLAHGKLASVFFTLIFKPALDSGSLLYMLIAWPMFGTVTIAILMMIDLLECFLHTIRLHWVEF